MDVYNSDINKLPAEEQQYFRSEEFRALSPSAKISVFKEKLGAIANPKITQTADQKEMQKWLDHDRRAELFLRQHAEEEKRREEARQAEAKKPRRW